MSTEDDVRALLHAVAGDAPGGSPDVPALVVRRHRARRRARVGAGVLAAAALLAVPLVDPGPQPPGPTRTVDGRTLDVLAGPTRGGLAGDAGLVQQLAALPWAGADVQDVTRTVAFAGDIGPQRTALVVARVDGRTLGAWFTGPAGASPGELRQSGDPAPLDASEPVLRLDTDPSPDTLVVLAAPGDQVSVSQRLEVTAAGEPVRRQAPLVTTDGAATSTLPDASAYGVSARVQVIRDGTTVYRGTPLRQPLPAEIPLPAQDPPARPGQPAAPGALVQTVLADLVRTTGYTPDDLTLQTLWSGSLPGPAGPVPTAVLAARFPSGATAVVAGWAAADPGRPADRATYCTFAVLPAGTDPADHPLAMRCDVSDPSGTTVSSLLLGPPGATRVEVRDAAGDVTATHDLDSGVSTAPAEGSERTARFLDAAGQVLADVPLSPYYGNGTFAQTRPR
ncbi:hypothetical protein GB931_16795 [Modestobacter sp. I12A-02628]|uniref:Uncharacterized protein n=1 Tax=Goekera deserti TaxID=2497753 RepID=A0A7K3WDR6_9ACTN|nr:hypothetical protein [Goekera deserti]MPQ99543.1 hypothetical protein [Goekera deserti]NDI46445.1 hypothetical protein [Goekera deserti]NEL54622.1 hypothetical protein [Goekera deserti]